MQVTVFQTKNGYFDGCLTLGSLLWALCIADATSSCSMVIFFMLKEKVLHTNSDFVLLFFFDFD